MTVELPEVMFGLPLMCDKGGGEVYIWLSSSL